MSVTRHMQKYVNIRWDIYR